MNIYQRELHLSHMTSEEKRIYNKHYYQEHKDYWVEWNKRNRVQKDSSIRQEYYNPNGQEAASKELVEAREKADRAGAELSYWQRYVRKTSKKYGAGDVLKAASNVYAESLADLNRKKYAYDKIASKNSLVESKIKASEGRNTTGPRAMVDKRSFAEKAVNTVVSKATSAGKEFVKMWKLGLNL